MSADEGSHFLETARPWDCGYFHTLYAWYAHAAWKVLGESVIRMRWFALLTQLACSVALSVAALNWLRRSGCRQVPAPDWLVPLVMTWSLVCYTLGSITVTYTSLANWAATLWLASVLRVDNREQRVGISWLFFIWLTAAICCTSKPSTGGLLFVFSFLITCGWRMKSEVSVRRLQSATLGLFVFGSVLLSLKVFSTTGNQAAWDISEKSSPIADFFTWATRYLASDSLRLAVSALWLEPCREMGAALSHYSAATAGILALLICQGLDRFLPAWSRWRIQMAGAFGGFFLVFQAGGLADFATVSPELKTATIVFLGAMGITALNSSAGMSAVVCMFLAQFACDAASIYRPRTEFLWAADHEFRLAFMALVMSATLWWLSKRGGSIASDEKSAVNLPVIVFASLLMPVTGWFGSGCLLGARAGYQYAVWIIIAAIAITSATSHLRRKQIAMLFSFVMTAVALNVIYVSRTIRPINGGLAVAGEETRKVKTGPKSEELIFSQKAGGFVSRVKSVLKNNGFQKGDPIFAFYDFPGLVYLVGGISPGGSWYMPPSTAAHVTAGAKIHQYNMQRLASVSADTFAKAFVFQTDHDSTLGGLMAGRGVKFPDDFDRCAEILIPTGLTIHRRLTIWKPKAAESPALTPPPRSPTGADEK